MTAIKIFTCCYGGIRIKVRVLPTIEDVHREYTKGKRMRNGKTVHAFFAPMYSQSAKYTGTMVLPMNGRLEELIPHETVHAVMGTMGAVHCSEDENLSTAVGILSARISRKLSALLRGNTQESRDR